MSKHGKMDVEKVLRGLVEKHNQLAISSTQSSNQLVGNLESMSKVIGSLQQQIGTLHAQNKVLTFHLNKIQGELAALRNCLATKGVNLDDFKKFADVIFMAELGINSDYIPVGTCTVTRY